MGCHTWIYIAQKNQDEILSKILLEEREFIIEQLNMTDEELHEDYSFYVDIVNNGAPMSFDDFKNDLFTDLKKSLELNDRRIPIGNGTYGNDSYKFRNNKIYLEKRGGDSLGRIHGFYDHEFYDADSVLKAFNDNNCKCDETTIKELFSNNDVLIIFG